MEWFGYTVLFSFTVATLILAVRSVDARVNPFIFMAWALSLSIVIVLILVSATGKSLAISGHNLGAAMLAGFFGAIVDLAYMMAFRRNAPVSLVVPLIRVASILLTALIGLTLFAETLSSIKILGIVAACLAIFLLRKKPQIKETTP